MLLRRMLVALGAAGSLLLAPAPARAAAPPPQDVAFLQATHQVNVAEIAAGRIAWRKTTAPEVKAVAAALMVDHIKFDFEVFQTARALRVPLPGVANDEQQALNRRYEIAGADTFDEYFISTQLAGHRETLRAVESQAVESADPSVRALAAKAIPVIVKHQELLRTAAEAEGIAGYTEGGGRP